MISPALKYCAMGDKEMLWFSGFASQDKGSGGIYFSQRQPNGTWSEPALSFYRFGKHIADPAMVKHPTRNQIYMFYSMRNTQPKTVTKRDRYGRRYEETLPNNHHIGVTYASFCNDSPDGSGMCWTNLSEKKPLIGDSNGWNKDGAMSPSVFIKGTRAHLYYKTNAPSSTMVRTIVDLRDWKRVRSDALTFQRFNPFAKEWRTAARHEQVSLQGRCR